MKTLKINTRTPYDISIKAGLLRDERNKITKTCQSLASMWVIVTDQALLESHAQPLRAHLQETNPETFLLSYLATEETKTRDQKQFLEDQLFELGCNRDTCLIALGGGVTTDMVGFIAATYCRGIPVIYCPTTLLGMVDASIGGKTGVNTPYGKNLIGNFKQPNAIFIDPTCLESLSKEDFTDGIAEIIKHALLSDTDLFELLMTKHEAIMNRDPALLTEIIYRSCAVKKYFIEEDETEVGARQLLNLGHTFAHALESLSHHKLTHGQAVSLGLVLEAKIAVAMDIAPGSLVEQIRECLELYHLPTKLEGKIDLHKLLDYLKLDKKNTANDIHFCFVESIGKPYAPNNRYSHPVGLKLIEASIS